MSSLRLGERVLAWSDDGLLAAEYALFDSDEIVLHATDPVTIREAGYMTTATRALERLSREGVTPDLADDAARGLSREAIASFARGATSRAVAPHLGAHELFDGAIRRSGPNAPCYEGAWLDLRALTQQLEMPSASVLIQALHLAAALSEVSGDTPLHMSTAAVMRNGRPGERTYQRTALQEARGMPAVLGRLRPRTMPIDVDPAREARLHPALVARVRERMSKDTSPRLRAHLVALDDALSACTKLTGPMADGELQALERQLDQRDVRGVAEHIDRLEMARGSVPGTRYLRARLALLRGDESPRVVAQKLSELADETGFHEAALMAARTWLAAGEEAHARYFAHRLVEDPSATDGERLVAMEILDTVPTTTRSLTPPPVMAEVVTDLPRPPRMPRFLGLGTVPAPGDTHATSLPPQAASPGPARPRMRVRYEPELVESLALPPNAREEDLGVNDRPTSPVQARIAMTRLARDLARDYRLWYGKTLRCNVIAIDSMQQHLTNRFANASVTDEAVAWELRRHGALVSEILARELGAQWIDVGPSEPGYWAMSVPPGTRTHPIGRVYRFVTIGSRERDLVGYFIELEQRQRGQ